jgi:hypothetical protein
MASFSMSSYVTPMSSPRQLVAPGAPMRLSNKDKFFILKRESDDEITRQQTDALWDLLSHQERTEVRKMFW